MRSRWRKSVALLRLGNLKTRKGRGNVDNAEADCSVFVVFVGEGEEVLSVEGDSELGADGGDAESVFLGDIDREFSAFEFAPGGAIHLSEKNGILAGFDADEVTAMSVVTHRASGGAKENAGAPAFAVVVEVDGDRGGEVIRNLIVEEDLFAAAIDVDRILWR